MQQHSLADSEQEVYLCMQSTSNVSIYGQPSPFPGPRIRQTVAPDDSTICQDCGSGNEAFSINAPSEETRRCG
ncbi:unnamed protein product [Gadus morhua 'NCC']